MPTGTRVDPYRNFNFLIEIDGVSQARFAECSGFGASNDPIEYREGGENRTVRKLPGLTKYPNIVLKWGETDSDELYKWFKNIVNGKVDRRNGSIILLDTEGNEKIRWNFFNAWPTKWDGPDFNAKGNDVAIETLELVNEGVERA
jgi:phage tail-like protein